jgi:DHA2 family multidrug resistance protein-like MFS transporter
VAHQVFLYTYLSMAVIIALPAFIFARVPDDTSKNVDSSRKRSGS